MMGDAGLGRDGQCGREQSKDKLASLPDRIEWNWISHIFPFPPLLCLASSPPLLPPPSRTLACPSPV
ncbi:hypothetical protein E2C01_073316 [Portunus trituberculatus]|uniref:Uncharacterized protein n=1 Tax=Portunus trituberculatus TaxID=210409 RepID=A0A5B7ID04_PORTR|nr:hypothetical protein [Portunus trituberculatus]